MNTTDVPAGLRRRQVTLFDHADGTMEVKHDDLALPRSAFDKVGNVKQDDIVDNDRPGAELAFTKKQDIRR